MNPKSRRNFIKQASCAAVGSTTFFSTLMNLKSLNAAYVNNFMMSPPEDYKALVCLYMGGGNDSYNMLVPRDSTNAGSKYTKYANVRSNLALPFENLIQLANAVPNSEPMGLHPSMPRIAQLYQQQKMAFISNIGTLIEPISNKTQISSKTKQVPLGLYSHSDQTMHWQTSVPQSRVATGWGGKMADLLSSVNANTNISMNISLAGTNVFQTGNSSVEFALDPRRGGVGIIDDDNVWLMNTIRKNAIDAMVNRSYQDAFKSSYTNVLKNSREGNAQFKSALATLPSYAVPFADNDISQSFKMIANVINARASLGMKRQVFFVEYGGWDHHDEVLMAQNNMLGQVDSAIHSFQSALGQIGMSDNVVTFTISDFGRTLSSNGNGTDHGWGGNAMVFGNPVEGGRVFGTYPTLELNSSIELGGGVFIPSTSPDQYFAELALWYGVAPTDLPLLFPNIGNFYSLGSGKPIGFIK
jgi:uncharacterized protein (DUF1501 family)